MPHLAARLHDLSLRAKIVGAVCLASLLVILVASGTLFAHQNRTERASFQDEFDTLAKVIGDYAVAPISFGDERAIQQVIEVLHENPKVTQAILQDDTGGVLAWSGSSSVPPNITRRSTDALSSYQGWSLLIQRPLYQSGEHIGTLVIVADRFGGFVDMLHRFMLALALTTLGALALVIPLTWAMAGLILKGLSTLTANVTHIGDTKDYTVRVPASGSDEIGILTQRFNEMLDELEVADQQLRSTNANLADEVQQRAKLEKAVAQSSRLAGMAEVATGVLHNVGNVLNSINVSAQIVQERMDQSRLRSLSRTVELLRPHLEDPIAFYTADPKALLLPKFLTEIHAHLENEQQLNQKEIKALNQSIDHIKEVVAAQQHLARPAGIVEQLNPTDVVEDALRINRASMERHGVQIVRQLSLDQTITSDRHTLLQILVKRHSL